MVHRAARGATEKPFTSEPEAGLLRLQLWCRCEHDAARKIAKVDPDPFRTDQRGRIGSKARGARRVVEQPRGRHDARNIVAALAQDVDDAIERHRCEKPRDLVVRFRPVRMTDRADDRAADLLRHRRTFARVVQPR